MSSSATEVKRLIQAARRHLALGELHDAEARASEAIRLDGKEPDAYLVRAEAHRRLRKLERALADLAVAIRLAPDRPGPYIIRAEIFKRRNVFDQAIADATHALALDSRNAAAFSIRAQCRHAIGDREGAAEDVQEMLLLDPTRPIPSFPSPLSSGSDTPSSAFEDEEFRKLPGGQGSGTDPSVLADGKPVDWTYKSQPAISDEDAPEALGVASGYKPGTFDRPIPRYRAKRKRKQTSPLLLGLIGLALLGGGYYLAARDRNPPRSVDPQSKAEVSQSYSTTPRDDRSVLTEALPSPILSLTFDDDFDDDKNRIWENSGAVFVTGKVGRAVEFNGSTFLRVSGSYPAGAAPRTIAAWLKSNRGPVEHNVHILAYGPHEPQRTFGIMEAGGKWRFFDWGGGLGTEITIDQEWHHHSVTYDGDRIRYYFDGNPVAETDRRLTTVGEPLILGVSAPGDTTAFIGRIDELSIYDMALSESQIVAHRESGLAGRHAHLLADRTSRAPGEPSAI